MNGLPEKRKALVVEGGGMRGVFSAGVLDAFGAEGFDPFDLYIGVSAGACNLASHLGEQYGRNIHIIRKYSATSRFISLRRFLAGGHYMDLDWLWESTIRDCRLDLKKIFNAILSGDKEYIVVGTSADNGDAVYLVPDESSLEHYIKVSSSLPFLYRDILITDCGQVLDGGISDPVPVIKAYNLGADDITVIRSRHSGYVKKDHIPAAVYNLLFKKYPAVAAAMERRTAVYNRAVDFIKNPPEGVKVREISPSTGFQVSRTTRNLEKLQNAYYQGFVAGRDFIKNQI